MDDNDKVTLKRANSFYNFKWVLYSMDILTYIYEPKLDELGYMVTWPNSFDLED